MVVYSLSNTNRIPLDNCICLPVCCLWTLKHIQYFASVLRDYALHSASSRITSLKLCSHNDISQICLPIARCVVSKLRSFFFVVAHISLAHNITGKTAVLKRLARRAFSSFALSTSLIFVNSLHSDPILCYVPASMFRHRYELYVEYLSWNSEVWTSTMPDIIKVVSSFSSKHSTCAYVRTCTHTHTRTYRHLHRLSFGFIFVSS